jgi:hypothetical protein
MERSGFEYEVFHLFTSMNEFLATKYT